MTSRFGGLRSFRAGAGGSRASKGGGSTSRGGKGGGNAPAAVPPAIREDDDEGRSDERLTSALPQRADDEDEMMTAWTHRHRESRASAAGGERDSEVTG